MTKPTSLDRHLHECAYLVASYVITFDEQDYHDVMNDRTLLSLVAASAFYQAIEDEDKKKIEDLKARLAVFAFTLDKLSYLDIQPAANGIINISIVDFGLADYFFKDIVFPSRFAFYEPNSFFIKINSTINLISDHSTFKFDDHSMKNLKAYFRRMLSIKREETIRILRNKIESAFERQSSKSTDIQGAQDSN